MLIGKCVKILIDYQNYIFSLKHTVNIEIKTYLFLIIIVKVISATILNVDKFNILDK